MPEKGLKHATKAKKESKEEVMTSQVPINVQIHQELMDEIHQLYIRKNHDYGDSFHLSFLEEGMAACRIRLGDKMNRFKNLTLGSTQMVGDESVRDTLIDLANYAIMGVIEMERLARENGDKK